MPDQRRSGIYPPELRERVVWLVRDHEHEYGWQWEAVCSVAEKLGSTPETVGEWVRRDEIDNGARPGVTTDERERIRELERESRELRRAKGLLEATSAFFAPGLDP